MEQTFLKIHQWEQENLCATDENQQAVCLNVAMQRRGYFIDNIDQSFYNLAGENESF
jgi:hypothetical protein